MTKILFTIYNLAWLLALPFLKRSPRVSLGWKQRTLQEAANGPFDLWIQSASGGESLLTNMILAELTRTIPHGRSYRILATSGTKQGVDSLLKGCRDRGDENALETTVAYFPFDAPTLMKKAFSRFSPRLAVIVETELWPAFLYQARATQVPVLLVNGRMSEKSYRSYKYFRTFFDTYGPDAVWAISAEDRSRFARVMGEKTIKQMNNIKFDKIEPASDMAKNEIIAALLPEGIPFVLLGSIRKEEEALIVATISRLLSVRGDIVIGVFPKHIERADNWLNLLQSKGIPATRRSVAKGPCAPGSVIVWDVFGELAGAYGLAKTTFIGGSLVNLGGQNFLEPLVFGLKPIIGPYWSNFAWVSREIITAGLVSEVSNEHELTDRLLLELEKEESRDVVIEQVQQFLAPRKGGTTIIGQQILTTLQSQTER